ncbi:MAG: 4-hydroxythreonine-4-phosphate dehydrogenase PdxA [Erythrobacter sp.]
MSANTLPLAVSLGDPAGIGPELITQCWANGNAAASPSFFVAGGQDVLRKAAEACGAECPIVPITAPEDTGEAFAAGLPVLPLDECDYTPGSPNDRGAALALQSLIQATRFALLGQSSAVVTAPVSKSQLAKVGFEYPGQTEYFAEVSGLGSDDAVMMLAGPSLRAVPITVHIALANVPNLLSSELIAKKARIVANALARDFGIANPRLAVAGLNPHASEGGKFGDEEARIIEPAIAELRAEGISVTGPHSADAMFAARARERFDAALCMYHDQALIPLKALDFDEGVNITLGLPIIRTSPDHGTAFDIAGQCIADPGAMMAAMQMASQCAANRAAHGDHRA